MDGNREEVLQLILNNFTFLFLISRVQADSVNIYIPLHFSQTKKCSIHKQIKFARTIKMRRSKISLLFLSRFQAFRSVPGAALYHLEQAISVSMISIILLVCWGSWPHTLFFFLVLELVFL